MSTLSAQGKNTVTTRPARFAVGCITSLLPGFRRVPLADDVLPGDRFVARGYKASTAMRSAVESALVPGDTVIYLGVVGCQALVRCERTGMELAIWAGHFEDAFEDVRSERRRAFESRLCEIWSKRIEARETGASEAPAAVARAARRCRSLLRRAVVKFM